MSKEKENKLVPKLRFPEFKNNEEWMILPLKSACTLQAGKFVNAAEISEFRGEELYPCYGGNGLRGYTKTFTHDGTYSLIGRQGALCGNVILVSGKFHATEHAVVSTPQPGINTQWLYYILLYANLNQYATGQAQPGLSVENLEKVNIQYSKSEIEQQKIADCLSSLDDLITAETEKLESLKAHKRGLLQTLFPQEGETIPMFRFSEFKKSGEWMEKRLGDLTEKVGSGVTPLGGEKKYKSQGRPFVRSQNVGWGTLLLEDIVYIDEETHKGMVSTELKEGDVLLNITGASIGRSSVVDARILGGNVNQHVCIIRTNHFKILPNFLSQFLISNLGQKQIESFQAGGNREGLNFAQIRSFSFKIPPTIREQEKITDCLMSLDDRIIVQSEKIYTVKLHKKGLMQQLFPSTNDLPS